MLVRLMPCSLWQGVLCAGGSIDFQWNGNSGVWQTATPACPVTFVNGTAARPLIAPAVGSGGVKSLYLPVPGNVHPHLSSLRLLVYMFHCQLAGPMLKLRSVCAPQPTNPSHVSVKPSRSTDTAVHICVS